MTNLLARASNQQCQKNCGAFETRIRYSKFGNAHATGIGKGTQNGGCVVIVRFRWPLMQSFLWQKIEQNTIAVRAVAVDMQKRLI